MVDFNEIFPNPNPLIGVIHLPPMPGFENSPGFEGVLDACLHELSTLERAGFDGALIENEGDRPHPLSVNEDYLDQFIKLIEAAKSFVSIPVGLEILYDMIGTIKVAIQSQADFVRLDVFTDDTETRWGVIKACANQVKELLDQSSHRPLLLTDIHVKHGKNLTSRSLAESGKLAREYGADGLIVTGNWTGEAPSLADCQELKAISAESPLLVGSGFSTENAQSILSCCAGAIVASSVKKHDMLDPVLCAELRAKVNELT